MHHRSTYTDIGRLGSHRRIVHSTTQILRVTRSYSRSRIFTSDRSLVSHHRLSNRTRKFSCLHNLNDGVRTISLNTTNVNPRRHKRSFRSNNLTYPIQTRRNRSNTLFRIRIRTTRGPGLFMKLLRTIRLSTHFDNTRNSSPTAQSVISIGHYHSLSVRYPYR